MKTLGGLVGALALIFLGRAVGEPPAPPKPEITPEAAPVVAANNAGKPGEGAAPGVQVMPGAMQPGAGAAAPQGG